jgi:hypothetical protein
MTPDLSLAVASSVIWLEEAPIVPLCRSVAEWRTIVMDAYAGQPTLSLTHEQGQRLWGMEAPTCRRVLDGLVEAGLLSRTGGEQYCRADYLCPIDPAFGI